VAEEKKTFIAESMAQVDRRLRRGRALEKVEKRGEYFPEEVKRRRLGEKEIFPSVGSHLGVALTQCGVTMEFGCPGGHLWHMIDEISRAGIQMIVFGHEQGAVYAAIGYTMVHRGEKAVVCFGTVGPGDANAFPAMQQAFLQGVPVFYISGGIETEHDDYQNTIQESYAYKFFEQVTKMSLRSEVPWITSQHVVRGVKKALAKPTGPVNFEIGIDGHYMLDRARQKHWGGMKHTPEDVEWVSDWRYDRTGKPVHAGGSDPAEVAAAVKAISEAKRPFLIVGEDCVWEDCDDELREFVEYWNLPFDAKREGRGIVPETHSNYHHGFPSFKGEIDLIISVGVKVGFFENFGRDWQPVVQIVNSEEQTWNYLKSKAVCEGSLKATLRQILDYARANGIGPDYQVSYWLRRVQDDQIRAREKLRELAYKYGPDHPRYRAKSVLHPGYCSQKISEVLESLYDNKVRVVADSYTMSSFAEPFIQCTRHASYITSNVAAGSGHGNCCPVGITLAQRERGEEEIPVLSLIGDQGLFVNAWDIEVGARYRMPNVYLVVNNGGASPGVKYLWHGPNWDNLGEQSVVGNEFQGLMAWGFERPILRLDKYAECINAIGMRCERESEFEHTLREAFATAERERVPVLVDCVMDQHICAGPDVHNYNYALYHCHIPWDELPPRGKAVRLNWLRDWFPGLKDEPDMPLPDNWEPLTKEELKYEPRHEYYEA
jgi:thiamine pyrophosphate-dependent acetolactate synthase large subunit-like protein